MEYDSEVEENEDEDEETLHLRIQTLEARLKLKKLQSKKDKPATTNSDVREEVCGPRRAGLHATSVLASRRDRQPAEERPSIRLQQPETVQVPISPPKKAAAVDEPKSPGRVLLGIDKGLKGRNVSLRRPPTLRAPCLADGDPFGSNLHSRSSLSARDHARSASVSQTLQENRQKTFSERIAETRQQDKEQKNRADRLRYQRSTGFGVKQKELDGYKNASGSQGESEKPGTEHSTSTSSWEFSRDEVMKAFNKPSSGLLHRSNTVSGVRNTRQQESLSTMRPAETSRRPLSSASTRTALTSGNNTRSQSRPPSSDVSSTPRPTSPPSDSSLFEPFSCLHLSKRILPHDVLTRTLESKSILLLPSLLRTVKSPDYCLPSSLDDKDYVVFGIIASKSSPLAHKHAHKTNASSNISSLTEAAESETNTRGKYMIFSLTDLKWSLDLYLFTTAYTRFWKLTPGTVIAILNPSIMPPPPGKSDTGRFSLVLSSSDDTVLELGTSRDLGFCKAVKRDGKMCGGWVDKRHTEFCEWHVDRGVEKCRRGRMEIQGMSAPFGPGGRGKGRTGFFGGGRKEKAERDDGLLREGAQYDRSTSSRYYVAPSLGGKSAASLLDEDEGAGRGISKEERVRRRLAEREKEKEIARRLGEGGNGMGGEYLRLRSDGGQKEGAAQADEQRESVDAGALGLLGNKARNVHLSPLKRKLGGREGMLSPRKKTRFVTAKGIREAGRESFGVAVEPEQDDDDLDIV